MNYLQIAEKYCKKKLNKSEKEIETEIRKFFEQVLKAYINKNHGNAFTKPGRPDLEGCLNGWHFGIEVKDNKGVTSDAQDVHMNNIKKAGGLAYVAKGDKALYAVINWLIECEII